MTDLISVIVPAYNHENYIQECIKSIINQTYQNIELIIVDDGSKDATWQKINEMKDACEKRFINVIFETKQNQGTALTLNKAFSLVSGKYVFFVASDDLAAPIAVEMLYSEMRTAKYVLAVGDNNIVDKNSNLVSWDKDRNIVPYGEGFKTFKEFLESKKRAVKFLSDDFGSYDTLLNGNYITNGFMIDTDAFAEVGGYTNQAPLEDWYMNLQLAKRGKFKFIDKPLFLYRWHGANTVLQKKKMAEYAKQTIKYELEQAQNQNDLDLVTKIKKIIEKKKTIFAIPSFIKLYKVKDLDSKKLVLQIFNKEIILKNKPR